MQGGFWRRDDPDDSTEGTGVRQRDGLPLPALSRRTALRLAVAASGGLAIDALVGPGSVAGEYARGLAASEAKDDIPGLQAVSPDYFVPNRFEGKVLLITGAATGIGAATAIRAAREGATVVGVDRKDKDLKSTVSGITAEGHRAIAIVGNVAVTAVCDRMVAETVRSFGGLDLAVNAAGVLDGGDPAIPLNYKRDLPLLPNVIHEATDEYWDNVLATNITGIFKSLRAELRQLVAQGRGGAIVNVGSIAGLIGLSGNPAYSASKYGVSGITRSAAMDYARYGIRVNSVNMAATDTPMVARAEKFVAARQAAQAAAHEPPNPVAFAKSKSILDLVDGRISTPWEQAAVILFLLSAESSNLTGALYATDGGWTVY